MWRLLSCSCGHKMMKCSFPWQHHLVRILLTLGACAWGLRQPLCLCVCLLPDFMRGLWNKMNIPASFMPVSKGFQLRDSSKKVPFRSYSFIHSLIACKAAIFAFSILYRKWSVHYFYLTCVYAYIYYTYVRVMLYIRSSYVRTLL